MYSQGFFDYEAVKRRRVEKAQRLVDRRIESVSAGFAGREHGEREWYDRMPDDQTFQVKKQRLYDNGMSATVVFWAGPNEWAPQWPLIGLEVRPDRQEDMLSTHHGAVGNQYHISIAQYTGSFTKELRDFAAKYQQPRRVHLHFDYIKDNGYASLDKNRDPIASDPVVRALAQTDPKFGARDLHISM